MREIPDFIYSGTVCDCYIGKVKKVNRHIQDKSEIMCELDLVKSLFPGSHALYLDGYVFTTWHRFDQYTEADEVYYPHCEQLIQVLRVGEGYGYTTYIKLLRDVDDVVPIPRNYKETMDAVKDNYAI